MGWDAWSGLPGGNARFLAACLLSPPRRHAGSKAVVAGWKPAPRTLAYRYAQIGQCLFTFMSRTQFHSICAKDDKILGVRPLPFWLLVLSCLALTQQTE